MNKIILLCLFIGLSSVSAFGQLGKTRDECGKKFGTVREGYVSSSGCRQSLFERNGMRITVISAKTNDCAVQLFYESKRPFTAQEIVALLTENGDGRQWKPITEKPIGYRSAEKVWIRDDEALAYLIASDEAEYVYGLGFIVNAQLTKRDADSVKAKAE